MAKKYRGKLHSIYGGSSAAGRDKIPLSALKGMTPKQHCEKLVMEASKNSNLKGYFKEESVSEDVCMLPHANYFGGGYLAPVYSYYYETYEKIELSSETDFKWPANTKRTTIGVGEGITISSNVAVKWEIKSSLVKINRQNNRLIHLSALDKAGVVVIKARHDYDEKTITLRIITPSKVEYSLGKYMKNGKIIPMIFHKKGTYELILGLRLTIHPKNVNFGNIQFVELNSASVNSGIFKDGKVHCHAEEAEGSKCTGTGKVGFIDKKENLLTTYDVVGGGEGNPKETLNLPDVSAMHLNIQTQWALNTTNAKWHNFGVVKQSVILYKDGSMTVSKGNFSFSITKNTSFEDRDFVDNTVKVL